MGMFLLYILNLKLGYLPSCLIPYLLAKVESLSPYPTFLTEINMQSVSVYDILTNNFILKQEKGKCGGNSSWADTSSDNCMFCTK